jgi:hypothetical protein
MMLSPTAPVFRPRLPQLLSLIEPFRRWRVPVSLLAGTTRLTHVSAKLLVAGEATRTNYFAGRFFASPPTVEKTGRVPITSLRRVVDEWKSEEIGRAHV